MTLRQNDTDLDALAAQVRAVPALGDADLSRLLVAARTGDAGARTQLIEQQLAAILAGVLGRRQTGFDVFDLYQEGAVAAAIAVDEYLAHDDDGPNLRRFVTRVVERHVDTLVAAEAEVQRAAAQMLEEAELLQAAELVLRRELERMPTPTEVGAHLDWTPEHVDLVAQTIIAARESFDEEISLYLDEDDTPN